MLAGYLALESQRLLVNILRVIVDDSVTSRGIMCFFVARYWYLCKALDLLGDILCEKELRGIKALGWLVFRLEVRNQIFQFLLSPVVHI